MKQKLEELYKRYPRKIGKHTGFERLKKTVKTNDDLALFEKAMTNYLKYLAETEQEDKYIKHWSTFCTQWRDWEDYESQTVTTANNILELIK